MGVSCFCIKEDGSKCGSRFNLKEVEFRHPNYSDLSARIFLCEPDFNKIFGRTVLTQEHVLPLEEEIWLKQKWISSRETFYKDMAELIEKVKAGVGLEFFDLNHWTQMEWLKVDTAYKRYDNLRRRSCRFEGCKKMLTNFRNIYIIRVYPKNQLVYFNLFFCSLDHWEVFKKRCGFTTSLSGILNPNRKKFAIDLDTFN